jgi:hypothetical protein
MTVHTIFTNGRRFAIKDCQRVITSNRGERFIWNDKQHRYLTPAGRFPNWDRVLFCDETWDDPHHPDLIRRTAD